MASGALHDLFQDMYRYSDPATYPQEGALSHNNNPAQPASYPYTPQQQQQHSQHSQPTYQPSNTTPSSHTAYTGHDTGANHAMNYHDQFYNRPSQNYQSPSAGQSYPPQAPPTYSDVQTHRDQVAYPYQSSQPSSTPQYPYQGSSQPNQYPYPHSVSSSTSELSDISSGIGTSDGKPCGSSPALGSSMMTPGGAPRPYTSGSSVDSSSGVGSYRCETPERTEIQSVCLTQTGLERQDSFPPPPPPLPQEASVNNHVPNNNSNSSYPGTPPVSETPKAAPPPAPPLPPPPPPLPPPTKSWKANQNEDKSNQQAPQTPPTRLQQQLSNMSINSDYGRQNSFPAPPPPSTNTYQPQSPHTYTPSHPQGAPMANSHYGGQSPGISGQSPSYGGQSPSAYGAKPTYAPQSPSGPKPMPDAVLNMAAKGEPDKKPWAYAPDMDVIKEQRDKVRRRAPAGGMPKYQQLLNLPQFDEGAPQTQHTGHQTPTTPPQNPYAPGPGEANVAHLQYNSPLQMYSGENVREAFTGQTDGVVTGVQTSGGNKDNNQDITQSPVYRMIHGLDNKPKPRPAPAEAAPVRVTRAPAGDDELTFSGIGSRSDIPSKSFQRLQSMTGGSEIDTTSIRGNVSGDALEPDIGDYDQASIRYTGRNIPSKSFRMLQSMTGPEPPMQAAPARRQRKKPEPTSPEQNPDDIVDISYVGGNIPSRSFKVLQNAMGQPDQQDHAARSGPDPGVQQPETELTSEEKHALASERRRRRRTEAESQVRQSQSGDMGEPDGEYFDEDQYLSGNLPIHVGTGGIKPRPKSKERSRETASWQKTTIDDPEPTQEEEVPFDEESYLSGRIPIINETPKQPIKPLASEAMLEQAAHEQEQEPALEENGFDESDYLAGKVSILGGESMSRKPKLAPTQSSEAPSWQKKDDDDDVTNNSTEFDEDAYLSRRMSKPDKSKEDEEPEWAKKRKQKLQQQPIPRELERFEPNHYLGIHEKEPCLVPGQFHESAKEDVPEEPKVEESFDEDEYLRGNITIVGGGTSLPPRAPNVSRSSKTRASWQKDIDDDDDASTGRNFDEDEYLRGKVPILRDSVDRDMPAREYSKPKQYREKASWERSDDDDTAHDSRKVFDVRRSIDRESPAPMVNGANDRRTSATPPRKIHYLRRSMSREGSPPSSFSSGRSSAHRDSFDSQDSEDSDSNKVYNDMMYVGKNIPSKTFLKLKKSVVSRQNKKKKSVDHIEQMRQSLQDSVPIDKAIDSLNIGSHDPDQYLNKLKETVQANNNLKIEADSNEMTDF